MAVPFDALLWAKYSWRHTIPYVRIVHVVPAPANISRFFRKLDRVPQISFVAARSARTLVSFILITHVLSCALYWLSQLNSAQTYANAEYRDDNNNEHSNDYVRMIYFGLLCLSSVLTDDIAVDRDGGGRTWEYIIGGCPYLLPPPSHLRL
eukprot:4728766-Pleurochrysis_carterae.AAC.4